MQWKPTMGSKPCAVRWPGSTLFAPVPALLNRTWSLHSCLAKELVAALTMRRSVGSRWRNLMVPLVVGFVDVLVMALMAASTLPCVGG
jgi:hypothetical protein